MCNEGDWMIVGGVESMSCVLFVMVKNSQFFGCDVVVFDSIIGVCFFNFKVEVIVGNDIML